MIPNSNAAISVRRAPGFTRIELLAVMAVLFLMTATLLPAVMQAQQDSRLVRCKDNLKQFGLAMHNYHDTYNRFPPAWVTRTQGLGYPCYGWHTRLLPYMDQAPLYNHLNFSISTSANPQIVSLLKTSIPRFRCSLETLGPTNDLRGGWGTSSYSGNFGSTPLPRWGESSTGPVPWPGHIEYQPSMSMIQSSQPNDRAMRPNGLMGMNWGAGIRDITDGTSNTLLIGERSSNGRGGIWPGPQSNANESDVLSDASFASPFNRSDTGFSSRHRGVIPFLLCDGSVRTIRSDLDGSQGPGPNPGTVTPGVLQKLASRDGGEVIGEF